jgi:hypothetical protein
MNPDQSKTASWKFFWMIFFLPALLALASVVFGRMNSPAVILSGAAAVLASIVTSIYCGNWLGKKFFKTGIQRVFATLFLAGGIFLINLGIVWAGCADLFGPR